MTLKRFKIDGVLMPANNALLRQPTRPVELRDPDFEKKFDRHTLIYDAIAAGAGEEVRLVCPPFLNLHDAVSKARFTSPDSTKELPFVVHKFDRQSQILIKAPPGVRTLRMSSEVGDYEIKLSPRCEDLFAGQRVVFTVSKDNKLDWIKDWCRFYRDVHGATAFLIIDNSSTTYSVDDLLGAISEIGGIACAAVVHWPFRFGAVGLGQKKFWDSDFCKLGAFEVARWRFLREAKSVLNCDIDELVLSKTGRSIFDYVENHPAGVIAFYGDWIFGLKDVTRVATELEPIRFRDFRHVLKRLPEYKYGIIPHYPMRCRAKWAAVPRRCPPTAQWHVHTIKGWWSSRIITQSFKFRHFREINTNWKYDRQEREPLNMDRHSEDNLMLDTFARVKWDS